jgi:aldehyde:ferredoxin oxidoreductase
MAWTRHVLRVNLSEGSVSRELLNMDWVDRYLGQRSLATKYLVNEIDPTVDALSPVSVKNKPEYWGASGGLEHEATWALGSDTGIDDPDALTHINFLCNKDGYDPIYFGATVAAGAITDKDTGGIAMTFGSAEALIRAAELVATGEGFGKDTGLGSKRLCEKYGHPELSMTVKGQAFPAYDPRGIQGMGLAHATSNRGACHLRGYTVASEVPGVPEKTDPLVEAFQDATAAVDSAGLCVFTTFAWTLEDIAPQIDAACEGDWS